jgi:hypothetical protein
MTTAAVVGLRAVVSEGLLTSGSAWADGWDRLTMQMHQK